MGDPGFISGFIGVVIDRLIQVIEKDVMTAITCREELRSLEKLVKEIQPVNMAIQQYRIAIQQSQSESVKNIEPVTVNIWLKKLNSTLEDAREIVLKCQVSSDNLVSRYILSKKIRKSIDSLQGHLERLPLIGFSYQLHSDLTDRLQSQEAAQNQSSIPSTSQPSLESYRQQPIQEPCIVEQDELFVNLKSLVMDDKEITSSSPSRVGVFGMGGAGKTLLLKRVHNDKEVQQHYEKDLILWLTVTHNLSIINLRNNLGRQINLNINEGFDEKWGEEDVRRWIHEKMSSRRFLLFLDDIWDDSETILEMLGVPEDNVHGNSKIVVSTRDRRVLAKMRVRNPISMDYLSPEESWRLFCFHAFAADQYTLTGSIDKIARDVCAECDRMPLALKVIGAAMAGLTAPSEWQVALEKLRNADKLNPQVEKKLYNRLRFSYDALCTPRDFALQLCFLYMGAFKEDEDMYIEDVITLWIGEGLLQTEEGKDPLEIGRSHANFLLDRCLIEATIKDAGGQVVACSMHDVLHDLALEIAEKEENCYFRAGKSLEEFPLKDCIGKGRISLMENKFKSIPAEFKGQDVRVMLLSESKSLEDIPSSVMRALTSIRVLDLGGTSIKTLPDRFGALKHLVFLRLARTPIEKLPDSVTRLRKLQILDLSHCAQLSEFPYGLHKMTRLIYLDLSFCQGVKYIPCGISTLTSLQYLKMEKCWQAWQQTPQPRKTLCDLTGGRPEYKRAASFSDLHSLKHLKWLALEDWSQPFTDGVVGNMVEMRTLILRMLQMKVLPEDMKIMVELNTLVVQSNVLDKIPSWICDFQQLSCLILKSCRDLQEIPVGLEKLERLRRLDIIGSWSLKELPDAYGKEGAFPSLESFWLDQTRTLEVFPPISQGAMPLLKKLGLVVCLDVKTLPSGLQNLQNLREVHVYESPLILKSMEEEGSEAWSTVRQLEGEMLVEILKESTANHRHKRMEKRMGNKYWWDRFLSNMWMDFNIYKMGSKTNSRCGREEIQESGGPGVMYISLLFWDYAVFLHIGCFAEEWLWKRGQTAEPRVLSLSLLFWDYAVFLHIGCFAEEWLWKRTIGLQKKSPTDRLCNFVSKF